MQRYILLFSIILSFNLFSQFQPQSKQELQTAINLWVSDNESALTTYGIIDTWDVSLITDMNSRVPVYVNKTNVDGMVIGDNTEYPKLEYVEDPTMLQEGDLLVTSGKGGVFLKGIPVGYIKDILPHQIIIEPYVNLEDLLFVTIQQKQ